MCRNTFNDAVDRGIWKLGVARQYKPEKEEKDMSCKSVSAVLE
jgi:hypothetical protein